MSNYANHGPTSPSSYSRWDHLDDSSDDEPPPPPIAPRPAPVVPPLQIRDDLEDYFRRLDERLSRSDDGPADVPRFRAGELDDFLAAASRRRSPAYEECAICLNDFDDDEDVCVLPCAAAHQFKRGCARAWLEKNTHCPLCRVDILPIHRATATQAPAAPPSPRALGFTRDGGTISRWEPAPPPDVPRPDYVPAHLRDAAGYVEVEYPDQGVARVWRVPQGSNQRPP